MQKAIFLIGTILLSSCLSYTRISLAEQKVLYDMGRKYIFESKISLSKNERNLIKSTAPLFSCYYTGYKYGQFFMTWKIKSNESIVVSGNGYLYKKESLYSVKKIID